MKKEIRQPILYFCSNGIGENLQASAAMRELRRTRYIVAVAKLPTAIVVSAECVDYFIKYRRGEEHLAIREIRHWMERQQVTHLPWTAHLDPVEEIVKGMSDEIAELLPREAPKVPCSASFAFWTKVNGEPPAKDVPADRQRMVCALPFNQDANQYDVFICTGSAEKMRRMPEATAVALANRLEKDGLRVLLYTNGGRPDHLHRSVNFASNRWNDATMMQMKELVFGSRVVVSPDTGIAHVALAYGKKVLWLQSREPAAAVIDPVHMDQVTVYRMHDPDCLRNCRQWTDPAKWPPPENRASVPEYPHNLECASYPQVPCLCVPEDAIETLAQLPIFR